MRSLFVAPMMPDEAGNGLAMRMGIFLEALSGLGPTDVLLLPLFGTEETQSTLCRRLDVRPTVIRIAGRLETHFAILKSLPDEANRLDAFAQYGKPSLSAGLSTPVLTDIRQMVDGSGYDLIHLARSYLLPVIDALPRGPLISVDLDEDDATTHRRIAGLHRLHKDEFTARWLELEARAFEQLIARRLPQADLSFIATTQESDVIARCHGIRPEVAANAVAIPAGVERNPVERSLLFVGGFGYFPNLDAAYWLLESVLPKLRDVAGDGVSMTIIGHHAPKRLLSLAEQAEARLLDHAGDLAPVYARSGIALVPLRAGGGSRIKLLEAAAYRVPIVATTAGAENSGFEDGREIRIADTPAAIAEACLAIWNHPEAAEQMALAAETRVKAHNARSTVISTLGKSFATAFSNVVER